MRLWHYKLIPLLPRKQLLGQWRELNSIYKKQDRHILINYIYNYPKYDLYLYSIIVIEELKNRNYKCNLNNFYQYFNNISYDKKYIPFVNKMNNRYLIQCLYNLQEKYDCGGISSEEWKKIELVYMIFLL